MTDDNAPLHPDVVEAFKGQAPSDVVPRSAPDPDALAALAAIPENTAVTLRMTELTEHGLREVEIEGLYLGHVGPRDS